MNKRNLGILVLIVVCACLIGLLIYYLIFFNWQKSNQPATLAPAVTAPAATLITNTPNTPATTTVAPGAPVSFADDLVEQDAGQVAKIFVERFGTYSNQQGAEQFSDLQLFITAKMQTWVDAQIAKLIGAQADYKIAHIVRTQAVSNRVASLNKTAGTATVVVSARRTDQTGDETPKISNPEIKLEMLKSGKRWQVDSVIWQ
jgi:hypothetical protein